MKLGSRSVNQLAATAACAWFHVVAVAGGQNAAIVIEDHLFVPAELVVPAGQKIRLTVENRDSTPEEFESYALNREKLIAAKSSASVWIGPLAPGRYPYFGDFNQKTAQGVIVAR
jgi:Cupredoxin-like domain